MSNLFPDTVEQGSSRREVAGRRAKVFRLCVSVEVGGDKQLETNQSPPSSPPLSPPPFYSLENKKKPENTMTNLTVLSVPSAAAPSPSHRRATLFCSSLKEAACVVSLRREAVGGGVEGAGNEEDQSGYCGL